MSNYKGMQKRLLAAVLSLSMVVPGVMTMQSQTAAAKTVKVKKLTLKKPVIKTLALKKGESYRLKWKVKPAKGKVVFTSGKKSVVTVNKKGKIKAKKPGTATVTIASKSKPKKSVKIKVRVYKKFKKASKVKLTATKKTIEAGKTTQLKATVSPKKATVKKVTYVSKNRNIATVNSKGVVTGKKKGTTTITAYAKDGRGAKASLSISVTEGAVSHTAMPSSGNKTSASPTAEPTPTEAPVLEQNEPGSFIIASDVSSADIYVDKNGADYDGLSLIAETFQRDVNTVSSKGAKPRVVNEVSQIRQSAIIAGSIGNNNVIDKLIADGKLDVSDIKNKRETYKIQVVENPAEGVKLGLVVVGSDKRGTIYGIYHISEKMGVSPWVYWGDVIPVKKDKVSFTNESYSYTSKEPSVKYRGIFLNDEFPSLTGWVKKKFLNYNEKFYVNVYELLLRCKGNYLWPAMWSNKFSEDGKSSKNANAVLADKYGVIMGTSHHEPLCRAGVEWQQKYKDYSTSNAWDFNKNEKGITNFWRDGVKRNMAFENVYTLGMRGESDSALGGTVAENINLLKRVITTQKNILKDNNLQDAPQVLTVYKEVEDFWHGNSQVQGLKKWNVLDDVMIMLCDDNFGNMRTLPEGNDINRKGGWGMYYHFDYHGGPTSYEWVNTVQLDKVWEQMSLAYEHGVDDMWIVNVGDLKPMEMNISYFLDLAYDYDTWGKDGGNKTDSYMAQWVEQQFGDALNKEQQEGIQSLLEEYTWLNGTCKPEVVSSATYSATNYNEAQEMLGRIERMTAKAEEYKKIVPERLQAAYFQLVYFPTVASANVAKMQICSGLNRYFYNKKSTNANLYAIMVDECIALDKELQSTYNKNMPGVGNKWEKMMSSPHVGYTTWNSEGWKYPTAKWLKPAEDTKMAVSVENKDAVVTGGEITLDDFTNINQEAYTITLSNQGGNMYNYTATTQEAWLQLSKKTGTVQMQDTFEVSVDWSKVTADQTGKIEIQSGDSKVTINVKAKVYDTSKLAENTYVYANGYASVLPGRYTKKQDNTEGATVLVQKGYGKMGESLKIQPANKRYAKDVSKAPYAEYSVYLPAAGNYNVTVYSAPSNNLERDDVSICFGLAANDGQVQTVNTIDSNSFVPGTYNCSWPNDVKNNGRTTERTIAFKEGVNTIRIYAADPAFVLQKLVVSKESVQQSFLGPEESYYVGKKLTSKTAQTGLSIDRFSIPGNIQASLYDGNTKYADSCTMKAGEEYVYSTVLTEWDTYQFGVNGSSNDGAEVELYFNDNLLGTVTLGTQETNYHLKEAKIIKQSDGIFKAKVKKGTAKINYFITRTKKFYNVPGNVDAAGYDGSNEKEIDIAAEAGKSYEYSVKVAYDENYEFAVLGSSNNNAKVALYVADAKVGEVTIGSEKKAYALAKSMDIQAGKTVVRMEVLSGSAKISLLKINVKSLTQVKDVKVTASSQAEGKDAVGAYDDNEKTSWKPTTTDANPTITFDFGEAYAIDRFALTDISGSETGYKLEVYNNAAWNTVYTGNVSADTIYLQGKSVIKAQKVRFLFEGAVELSEVNLTPYINWAMQDTVTLSGVKKGGGSITVPSSIVDGDRISKGMEDGTGTSTDAERHTVMMKFSQERIVDTVRLITLQESEFNSAGTGVVPNLTMTSDRGQYSYRASYYDGSEWKEIGVTERPETGTNPKVFNEFTLTKPVKTTQIKIEIFTSHWIRINELEAVQNMRFSPVSA